MIRYMVSRFISLIPTALLMYVACFVLIMSSPGSPFSTQPSVDPVFVQESMRRYGLDRPIPERLVHYTKKLIKTGDFGTCFSDPSSSIATRLGPLLFHSVRLGLLTFAFSAILGTWLGWIAAINRNTWIDHIISTMTYGGSLIPGYIWMPCLLRFLSIFTYLGNPLYGGGIGGGDLAHLILPIFCFGAHYVGSCCQFMRGILIEILSENYMRYAKAKGLCSSTLLLNHAIRPAAITMLPYFAGMLQSCLLGSMITERLFSLAGIAQEYGRALKSHDFYVILTVMLFSGFLQLMLSYITDIIQYGFSTKGRGQNQQRLT